MGRERERERERGGGEIEEEEEEEERMRRVQPRQFRQDYKTLLGGHEFACEIKLPLNSLLTECLTSDCYVNQLKIQRRTGTGCWTWIGDRTRTRVLQIMQRE